MISGIWLNTDTLGMSGKKIANENAINGADGEPSKHKLNTTSRRVCNDSNSGWHERFLLRSGKFPWINEIHLRMGLPRGGESDAGFVAWCPIHELLPTEAES